MGHFVYEELSSTTRFKSAFAAIARARKRAAERVFPEAEDAKTRSIAERILESWIQEIFCDLLAIRMVGPAFSFALLEVLELLGLLSPEKRVKFNQEHPAPACRFGEQVKLLKKDGWWDAIADIQPSQKKLIESLANVPKLNYVDEAPKGLMEPFLDSIVPAVGALVKRITTKPSEAVERFTQSRRSIEDCLWAGVVPHERGSTKADPISIINAAFCFYLTSLPKLIVKFEGRKAQSSVEKHSLWTERLENWTRKAVEDSQIQRGIT